MHPAQVPTVTVDAIPADAILLDCREDDEWRAGHIDGAIHIAMNSIPQRLQHEPGPITPDATIVVVCKMGGRSGHVAAWLNQNGYDARNLYGGMLAWAIARRPMVADGEAEPFVV